MVTMAQLADKLGRLEALRAYAKEHGGECLSAEYVNNNTRVRFRCHCGYEWDVTPRSILCAKTWCRKCQGNAPYTEEEVRERVLERGHDVVEIYGMGSRDKIALRCPKRHDYEIKIGSLFMKRRAVEPCPDCRRVDLQGSKFGLLTVLNEDVKRTKKRSSDRYWICRCECGSETSVHMSSLSTGATKSCGCLERQSRAEVLQTRKNAADLTGQTLGGLTVLERLDEVNKFGNTMYRCKCVCGKICSAAGGKLKSGHKKYCGCRGLTDETRLSSQIARKYRARVNRAIRAQSVSKTSSTAELIGCSIPELIEYLESLMLPGMTWENWTTDGWHIDHIKPCASFNLSVEEEQIACFHYTNLQPLWATDNLKKGRKTSEIPRA